MRSFSLFALGALSLLGSVAAVASPEPAPIVEDHLVSRSLEKRGSWHKPGYSNKGLYNISFYHINDVHAHLDEFRFSGASCADPTKGCVGGYSRVKEVVDRTRPTHKNSLFLNAGDEFQGTLFYTLYKGEAIADTLNQLGFDAMTLGNHEFDDGDDLLAAFLKNLTFPAISSNIHTTNKKLAEQLVPYKIFKKHQLAVLAVTTETTKGISSPGEGTTFEDPVNATQRTVNLIQRRHPDIKRIVALTHIGYEKDIDLAKKVRGVHLIIGGHSHTLLGDKSNSASKGDYPTIETNPDGEEVFIVTSYRWGEYLGYIDVQYDRRGKIVAYNGAPIHLLNTTKQDAPLQSEINKWKAGFAEYANTILGTTVNTLVQSTCQTQECTLGDFTADSMADFRPTTADGAMINAGGIRAEIDAGDITLQMALECFPFGNSIVELTFTGAQLWDIFEGIYSRVNQGNGRAVTSGVQVSKSIRLAYNNDNPAGSRLISLEIGGAAVELAKTYTIATLDFLAGGGDNFWEPRTDFTTLDTMDEVWAEYVKEKSPIDYKLDGRLEVSTETTPQKPTA
ncbi:5'-nucleotidase [Geopyxis carbonaria]|nr:5'-nucleotidase [Geopyxis carbonaria]